MSSIPKSDQRTLLSFGHKRSGRFWYPPGAPVRRLIGQSIFGTAIGVGLCAVMTSHYWIMEGVSLALIAVSVPFQQRTPETFAPLGKDEIDFLQRKLTPDTFNRLIDVAGVDRGQMLHLEHIEQLLLDDDPSLDLDVQKQRHKWLSRQT